MVLAARAGRPAWLRVMPRIVALAIATEEKKEFVHAVVAEEVDIVILRICQLASLLVVAGSSDAAKDAINIEPQKSH